MTAVVFLEGPPGAGKTSTMVSLAASLGASCLAVPETNPLPTHRGMLQSHPPDAITRWFLDSGLRRDRLGARLLRQQRPRLAVFDRSYLSVLAYCYATDAAAGGNGRYRHVCRAFQQDIRPHLAAGLLIVRLTTTVGASLERRDGKQDREFEHQWYDPSFLEALHHFYVHEAPQLAVQPMREVDTTAVPAGEVAASVLRAVGDPALLRHTEADRVSVSLISRLSVEQLRDPTIHRYYEEHGGQRTFGQPLGEPVEQYAGTTQFFERHALLLEQDGTCRLFDPVADHSAGTPR